MRPPPHIDLEQAASAFIPSTPISIQLAPEILFSSLPIQTGIVGINPCGSIPL
jgi:hypothetical protein